MSLLFIGILTFKDRESGKKLKEAWDAFSIDTVRLADLSWTSEVTDIVRFSKNCNLISIRLHQYIFFLLSPVKNILVYKFDRNLIQYPAMRLFLLKSQNQQERKGVHL